MAVPSVMNDLSITVSNNSPAGSESPISTDDFHRAIQAILRTTNAKASDIASAATTDIGAATAEFVDVTGTTTITGLGTIGAGIVRTVRFTGALTLTHNATSLILPTGKNIPTAAGDVAMFRSLGSGNWVCVGYMRANGFPLNQRKGADVASATSLPLINDGNYFDVTGTTTITSFASLGVGSWIGLHFDGALILTHHATDLILPSGENITTAAGDEAIFVEYASGDWRCVSYTKANGKPVISNLELLATYTASASATIDITQGFDGSYAYLDFVFENIAPATNAVSFNALVSTNGGSSYITTATYLHAVLVNSAATAVAASDDTATSWPLNASTFLSNVGGETLNGKMQLFSAGVVGARPYTTSTVVYRTSSGNNSVAIRGQFTTNTGINAIRFYMSSGNIASGKIYVYGVRK